MTFQRIAPKYRILRQIGQGTIHVFCAVHQQSGHLVALKKARSTDSNLNSWLSLADFAASTYRHLSALEHPRLERYLVMDYCEGGTLRSLMQSEVH